MTVDTRENVLQERALKSMAEVDVAGVAAVADSQGTPLYDSATTLLPGARSIVVLGVELFPEVLDLVEPQRQTGVAMAGDLYEPHVDYANSRLNRALYDLAKTFRGAGYRALPLPSKGTPNDSRYLRGVLSFKHAGELAGLGSIGHSSLLLTPQFGPRVRLACLLTDAPLPPSLRQANDSCASCPEVCVEHCPSRALAAPAAGQPYSINKFACSAYRNAAGGCINCLKNCTAGR